MEVCRSLTFEPRQKICTGQLPTIEGDFQTGEDSATNNQNSSDKATIRFSVADPGSPKIVQQGLKLDLLADRHAMDKV